MYNSFAIWHKKRDGEGEISTAELHFNLWQFSSQKNINRWHFGNHNGFQDFLDIGIKIDKISNLESVYLFVPCELKKYDVRDLGKTITKNTKLLTAIFNEVSTVGTENAKLVQVKLRKQGDECLEECFSVYIIDESNNINVELCKEGEDGEEKIVGTIIIIKTSYIKLDDSQPVYLRIRIKFSSQGISNKIIHQYVPKDFWLQSSTVKQQFVDFRLNEKRNLPKTIQEMCVDNFLKIKKVHFFLMREFADEPIMSDPVNSGYRVLESDTWSEYVCQEPNIQLNHMIAYHWKLSHNGDKEESYVNSFTLSTKFSFQESSIWKILIFLVLSLVLGAFGGVAGNFATKLIEGSKNNVEKTEQSKVKSLDSTLEKIEPRKSGKYDN